MNDTPPQISGDTNEEVYPLKETPPRKKLEKIPIGDQPVKQNKTSAYSLFNGALPLEHETSLFILVSVLDVLMTWYLLSGGTHIEANPVAAYFIQRWGGSGIVLFKFTLVTFVCIVSQVVARKNISTGRKILQFGTAVVACVVIYSFIISR